VRTLVSVGFAMCSTRSRSRQRLQARARSHALAFGLLVDDAIIAIEMMVVKMER
jgi:hypothetical protein